MMNTHGKTKTAVPASKKQKIHGAIFSSNASAEVRHPYLRFSVSL